MSEKTISTAAMILPSEQIDFIRRNPELTQQVGKLTSSLIECKAMIGQLENILRNPQVFAGFVENGTQEELESFLKAILENQDKSIFIDEGNEEEQDKALASINADVVTTKFVD